MKLGNTPITHVLYKSIALAGIVSAALLPAGGAHAQTLFHLLNDQTNTENIQVTDNGGTKFTNTAVGRYSVTLGNGPTINAWCTDATHNISFDGTYQANINHHVSDATGPLTGSYYNGGLSSALSSGTDYVSPAPANATARADGAAYLIDSFLNSTAVTFSKSAIDTNFKDNMAALQMSIWDIVQDGGDGLATGTLQAKGENANLDALVAYYEGLAGQHSAYTSQTTTWIQAPVDAKGAHLQDFATSSVPEPGSVAMLAGLFVSGSGMVFRRRNRTAKA